MDGYRFQGKKLQLSLHIDKCYYRRNLIKQICSECALIYPKIKYTQYKQKSKPKTRIFVKNLAYTLSEGTMATLFCPYGTLTEVKLIRHKDTWPFGNKGYGFVRYINPESAVQAIDQLQGYELNGGKLKLEYAKYKRNRYKKDGLAPINPLS